MAVMALMIRRRVPSEGASLVSNHFEPASQNEKLQSYSVTNSAAAILIKFP